MSCKIRYVLRISTEAICRSPNGSHEEEFQAEPIEVSNSESAAPTPPADPVKEAESKKEAGNAAFRAKNFTEAIERYSEAIGA